MSDTEVWTSGDVTLYLGDCREVMAAQDADSIDAIVCDPPYGLKFMGKGWDHGVPGVEFWEAALRVAKPGAHLLAFGGTRTHHRLMCAIEDAGWEIRDCVMWVYGSGFPKSLDVSKAIDKAAGAEREVVGRKVGRAATPVQNIRGGSFAGGNGVNGGADCSAITSPATDAAKQWHGWGTALKPAWEPIILARKPLDGTVASNVLTHGVGGLNIDGCRIGTSKNIPASPKRVPPSGHTVSLPGKGGTSGFNPNVGRWPANLIHDGSDEVVGLFPKTSSGALNRARITADNMIYGKAPQNRTGEYQQNSGSAARFFYCAKASKRDRDEGNHHPAVKPTALMQYLIRLVTPKGGVVLDPFMGSGSTGKAAMSEGARFVGIETDREYFEIAKKRIEAAQSAVQTVMDFA